MAELDPMLQQAIDRVCSPDSFYWAFRELEGAQQEVQQCVEIRLDLPPEHLNAATPEGWELAHRTDGVVFLRRTQALTDDALKQLFVDALTLASERDGRFHSWVHGDMVTPHEKAGS